MDVTVDRWTIADLARFPDDDTLRYEIIDGELHVTKAPDTYHQIVASRIAAAIERWSAAGGGGLTMQAPGIVLPDEDNLIPDVVWISEARFLDSIGDDHKLHALPELVVEVLSPGAANRKRDREEKLAVYRRGGVVEYWIVDWPNSTITTYTGPRGRRERAFTVAEQLVSALLPGLNLDLVALFKLPGL